MTLREEPYRIFFPLGVVLGWAGIGHWLLYATGVSGTYSCGLHATIQMQAFMMAFATGFLLTAIPRRTQGAPATTAEIGMLVALLTLITGAALAERPALADLGYAGVFLVLLRFALRRFLGAGAGRRPPGAFVLIPLALAHGLGGVALARVGPTGLARLMIEQGVFLCLVLGVGSLVLPLMAGAPPPADLGSSPRERRKAAAYAGAGLTVFASLLLEDLGWDRFGPGLRALVVAAGLAVGAGAWRAPARPGLHRRVVWLSVWLVPAGLLCAALWPDYRVPALHVLFIGGFSLMVFGVATHVAFAHLGLEALMLGRPPAVAALAAALVLAMLARVAADASASYFAHLGWAAALWIAGSVTWLAFLGPKLWRGPGIEEHPRV